MRNKLACSLLFIFPFLTIKTCKDPNIKPCYDPAQIAQRWKNDYILVQAHDLKNRVTESYKLYPSGIFQLKKDGTYSVSSDEVPLDGEWSMNVDCSITLDKNNSNRRTFTVAKLTADSLIISRRDTATSTTYVQYYSKGN